MTKEIKQLFDVLPAQVSGNIFSTDNLQEIIIDLGRPVYLRYDEHVEEVEDFIVDSKTIDKLVNKLKGFNESNRCGVEGTLHRVSRILDKNSNTVGFTIRIGKQLEPKIQLFMDILNTDKNVLIVGLPGLGKTSFLRQTACYISEDEKMQTIIVDKTNEIAGDGVVPHPAVGLSRRLSVPEGKNQAVVLIEAVENHNPRTILVDEISNSKEADAVRTITERGVRMVATIHGKNIESVIRNNEFRALLGNVKTVTMSTDEAKRLNRPQTKLERESPPAFDVVVELIGFDTVGIYSNVSQSVDAILTGRVVKPEIRRLVDGKVIVISPELIEEEKFVAEDPEAPAGRDKISQLRRKKY